MSKVILILLFLSTGVVFLSKENSQIDKIKYIIYSNKEPLIVIKAKDILYYDTSQYRLSNQMHQLRLRNNFYEKDSYYFKFPIEIICFINNKKYFWAQLYHKHQAETKWYVNFNFNLNCDNHWNFPEQVPGEFLILRTKNECNNIEFFHNGKSRKFEDPYYRKDPLIISYKDTARFAHEYLLDPYYLNALRKSGVIVK